MLSFTDEQLEAFFLDVRRPFAWAVCPFCGETLAMGYRKGGGNLAVCHSALRAPDGTHVSGCERFRMVAQRNPAEFLVLAKRAGVDWHAVRR